MTDSLNEKEELTKKYNTYVKSGIGAMVIALVTTLIYILRVLLSPGKEMWFSTYITQFMLKSSGILPQYTEVVAKPVAIVVIAVCFFALLIPTILSQKKSACLYPVFALYLADTIMNIICLSLNVFGDYSQSSLIDVIFHLFILVFILVAIYGSYQLKKNGLKNTVGEKTEK